MGAVSSSGVKLGGMNGQPPPAGVAVNSVSDLLGVIRELVRLIRGAGLDVDPDESCAVEAAVATDFHVDPPVARSRPLRPDGVTLAFLGAPACQLDEHRGEALVDVRDAGEDVGQAVLSHVGALNGAEDGVRSGAHAARRTVTGASSPRTLVSGCSPRRRPRV